MIEALMHFFSMHGHGWYIWNAYGCVFIVLAIQWFIPWQRGRHLKRKNTYEQNS